MNKGRGRRSDDFQFCKTDINVLDLGAGQDLLYLQIKDIFFIFEWFWPECGGFGHGRLSDVVRRCSQSSPRAGSASWGERHTAAASAYPNH